MLAYDVPCTEDVGLLSKFRFNVGPASHPIAGSPPVNGPRCSQTLIHHWVHCIPCANTLHSPNAVLMLTHSLRCTLGIETTLGDCTGFSDCCMPVIMRVTLSIPAPETPDNTIHWPTMLMWSGKSIQMISRCIWCCSKPEFILESRTYSGQQIPIRKGNNYGSGRCNIQNEKIFVECHERWCFMHFVVIQLIPLFNKLE